jgi:hypothetical protein
MRFWFIVFTSSGRYEFRDGESQMLRNFSSFEKAPVSRQSFCVNVPVIINDQRKFFLYRIQYYISAYMADIM